MFVTMNFEGNHQETNEYASIATDKFPHAIASKSPRQFDAHSQPDVASLHVRVP